MVTDGFGVYKLYINMYMWYTTLIVSCIVLVALGLIAYVWYKSRQKKEEPLINLYEPPVLEF